MAKAYSYLRFSTPEQMQGDSYQRQTSLAAEYAAKHGLELDTELTFQDLGVSAYRGKNAEQGRLSDFLDLVENGTVPKGSYLLVESLDRVSRTTPRKAVRILERICEPGVNVVTLSDGKVYNEENLDSDGGMSLIMSVLIFIRANEESAMKSRRLKAVLGGTAPAGSCLGEAQGDLRALPPSWLRLDRETGTYHVIEEKAALVRRIFAMAANGYGLLRIAKILTDEGVPLLGNGKHWYHTTIRHITGNRAVLGEYQPHILEWVDGKKVSHPVGEPIMLYPPIISEALFDQVQSVRGGKYQDQMETWENRKRGRGSVNVFSGLCICARCGGTMTMQNKSRGDGAEYRYLVCVNARYGRGCKYSAINLGDLQNCFFRDVERILAAPPTPTGETEAELERLEGPISALEESIGNLVAAYERVPDPALLQRLSELRSELTVLKEREKALTNLIVNASGPVVQRRIEAVREAIMAEPRDNQRINGTLRALFNGLSLNPDSGTATLAWRGGGTTEFVFRLPEPQHLEAVREARKANLRPMTTEFSKEIWARRKRA